MVLVGHLHGYQPAEPVFVGADLESFQCRDLPPGALGRALGHLTDSRHQRGVFGGEHRAEFDAHEGLVLQHQRPLHQREQFFLQQQPGQLRHVLEGERPLGPQHV